MQSTPAPPEKASRPLVGSVMAIILAGSLIPVVGYWLVFGRIPTVTPQEAKQRLRNPDATVVLVDVRTREQFLAGHIDGAENWPLATILETPSVRDLPVPLRDKTLLLVCDVGMASWRAAWYLGEKRISPAMSVRGGIQEWIRSAAHEQPRRLPPAGGAILPWLQDGTEPQGGAFDRWQIAPDQVVEFPFRRSPVFEQAAAVIAYFFFKPIYMTLSVVVALVLWRSRSSDLVALRWGMVFFFLGEAACAVNYFGYRETSYLWEYLHGFGMLVSFGFVTYALLEGIDRRILLLSSPNHRCASLALCGGCIKYGEPSCGLKRVFFVLTPALLVLALMLPTADWKDSSYNTLVFGTVYNYAHLHVHQQFENWYCAAAAVVMLTVSLVILAGKRENSIAAAKVAFAAGAGPLMFGMLRMVLGAAYNENRVWFLWWEETTELLFIFGVCLMLRIFRHSLLPKSARRGSG